MVSSMEVDVHGEQRWSDDERVRLSSLRLSPIGSDNTLNIDLLENATLTDADVEPGHSCTDPHLHDPHPDCEETNGKITVDVDEIFVNATSSAECLVPSCENAVTNLA